MKENLCIIVLLTLFSFFIFGNITWFLIYKNQLKRIQKRGIFSELKTFERVIRTRKMYIQLFPAIEHILLEIEKQKDIFYKQTGVDLDFIAREAEDEYNNLNGLTTSEDEDDGDEECM